MKLENSSSLPEPASLLRAYESLTFGTLVLTPQGLVCWLNPQWCASTGYSAAELLHRSAADFLSGMAANDFLDLLQSVVRTEAPTCGESAWRTKSGADFIAEHTITPIRNAAGHISHLLLTTQDITARRHVEESLLASEFWLKQSQRIAGIGSYVLDLATGFWTSSETLDGIFGIDPGFCRDVDGWASLIHPAERQAMADYFRLEVIGQRKQFNREYRIVRPSDGQTRSVHGLGELVLNSSGTPVQMLGTIQDITDRKLAELALRESEHRYRTIFESSRDALLIADSQTGMLMDANPAAQALVGYSLEQILTFHHSQLHPPEDAASSRANFERDRREPGITEHVVLRPDGVRIPVEIAASPMLGPGGRALILGAFRDISERKREQRERERLEEHLQQSQKLESIGRLTGGVAHEFNNLLTVVNGYSAMLLHAIGPHDPFRRYVEQILKAGEQGASLTAQLLAFSRKQVIQLRPIDLNAVVQDAEQLIHQLVGEDIEFITQLEPALAPVVADPIQIHQVLMNLASNARDAMPGGGTLIIRTANAPTLPESVLLSVTDTGIGMDDETRKRIFEPFFTTKELGKGTGLGLATIHGIMHQVGGRIEVETQPGQGASFTCYLPATHDPITGPRIEQTPAVSHRASATILLVEDQEGVRSLIRTILIEDGYRVLDAADGLEALTLAAGHPAGIDLLITDLQMPKMSGRELAGRLRQTRPETKVLLISGHTSEAVASESTLEAGVSFLPKPFTPSALAARVRELLAITGASKQP